MTLALVVRERDRPLTREQAWWAGEAPVCGCGEPVDGSAVCPACEAPVLTASTDGAA